MPSARPLPPSSRGVELLAVMLLLTAAFGAWHAVALGSNRHDARTLLVGDVRYQVTHVEQVTGLSDADLAGMSHNIQGLVTDKQLMVRVSITASTGRVASEYDPDVLQLHVSSSRAVQAPAGGSFTAGRLSPHSSIEGTLSYVVPRDGAQLTLRARGGVDDVPLAQVDNSPQGPVGHHHPGLTTGPATAVPSPLSVK